MNILDNPKLELLVFFEREIDRWDFTKGMAERMKSEAAQMINKGEITEDTVGNFDLMMELKHRVCMNWN